MEYLLEGGEGGGETTHLARAIVLAFHKLFSLLWKLTPHQVDHSWMFSARETVHAGFAKIFSA